MQIPHFKKRGLDLGEFYLATLNLSISPDQFSIVRPDYQFKSVAWAEGFPSEDFSFIVCEIKYNGACYNGYIYYPHPETKIDHFQDASTLEVISRNIKGIQYGDDVTLNVRLDQVNII